MCLPSGPYAITQLGSGRRAQHVPLNGKRLSANGSDPEETATGTLCSSDTVTESAPTGADSCKLALLQQIPNPLIRLLKSGSKNPRDVVDEPEGNSLVGLKDFIERDPVQRQE